MEIRIICIGKLKERYWREAEAEYSKRLGRFCRLSVLELKEERLPENASPAEEAAAVAAEGEAILRACRAALDIRGKSSSSDQVAAELEQLALSGRSSISFLIGGSLGLSPAVLAAADRRLSFSAMTFPHQLMRIILLEQIYRAFKINHHETYHK